MDMKIVGISVAVLVSLVVLAGVLMPVLDDATATTETIVNDGSIMAVPDEGTHTIKLSKSGDALVIKTDGETCVNPDLSLYGSATIVFADNTFIRLADNGNVTLYGKSGSATKEEFTVGNISAGITIALSGTNATITNDSDGTKTRTFENVDYYISAVGDYALSLNPSITLESNIMGAGLTKINNTSSALIFQGSVEDVDNPSISTLAIWPNGRTATLGSVNLTENTNYVGLYKVDSIVLDWANDGNPIGSATYTYFVAPHEITVEKSVHLTNNENELLAVIPMLVIVAILIGVVALVIRSKLD